MSNNRQTCRWYLSKQGCFYGNNCKFLHNYGDNSMLCRYYMNGYCSNGNNCKYIHQRNQRYQQKNKKYRQMVKGKAYKSNGFKVEELKPKNDAPKLSDFSICNVGTDIYLFGLVFNPKDGNDYANELWYLNNGTLI